MGIEKSKDYYNQVYKKEYKPDNYFKLWAYIISSKFIKQNNTILDIGCGVGDFAKFISNKLDISFYTGIDFSEEAIKRAKLLNSEKENFKFINTDIFEYLYILKENKFDVFVILEVLEHLKNDILLLQKIETNKKIIISVPNFDSPGHVRFFNNLEQVTNRYAPYINIKLKKEILIRKNYKFWIIMGNKKSSSN